MARGVMQHWFRRPKKGLGISRLVDRVSVNRALTILETIEGEGCRILKPTGRDGLGWRIIYDNYSSDAYPSAWLFAPRNPERDYWNEVVVRRYPWGVYAYVVPDRVAISYNGIAASYWPTRVAAENTDCWSVSSGDAVGTMKVWAVLVQDTAGGRTVYRRTGAVRCGTYWPDNSAWYPATASDEHEGMTFAKLVEVPYAFVSADEGTSSFALLEGPLEMWDLSGDADAPLVQSSAQDRPLVSVDTRSDGALALHDFGETTAYWQDEYPDGRWTRQSTEDVWEANAPDDDAVEANDALRFWFRVRNDETDGKGRHDWKGLRSLDLSSIVTNAVDVWREAGGEFWSDLREIVQEILEDIGGQLAAPDTSWHYLVGGVWTPLAPNLANWTVTVAAYQSAQEAVEACAEGDLETADTAVSDEENAFGAEAHWSSGAGDALDQWGQLATDSETAAGDAVTDADSAVTAIEGNVADLADYVARLEARR